MAAKSHPKGTFPQQVAKTRLANQLRKLAQFIDNAEVGEELLGGTQPRDALLLLQWMAPNTNKHWWVQFLIDVEPREEGLPE